MEQEMDTGKEKEITLPQVSAKLGGLEVRMDSIETKLDCVLVKLDGVVTTAALDNFAAMVAEQFHLYDDRFGRLEAGQEKMQVSITRMQVSVDNLEEGQEKLEAGQQKLEAAIGPITLNLEDIKLKQANNVYRFEMVHMGKRVDRVEKALKLAPLEPLPA
jgi:hypothetical protein